MELSIESLGRLASCHGLLEVCYKEFCDSFHRGRPGAGSSDGIDDGVGDALVEHGGGAAAVGSSADDSWQAENMQHRRLGLKFVEADPLASLVQMRLVVDPLRQLLADKFSIAADTYEALQRAKEVESTGADGADGDRRSYRVLEAAVNEHENRAMEKLKVLFEEPSMWVLMPESSYLEVSAATTFRLLSAQGALLEELLRSVHRRYPYRMFLALLDEHERELMLADRPCIRDFFCQDFVVRHDLRTSEGLASLMLVAHLVRTEITEIECLHGSLRRLLNSMGMQTHLPDFEHASARWLAARWRKEERDPSSFRHRDADCEAEFADDGAHEGGHQEGNQEAKGRRGGGGAWRAFVHQETSGQPGRPDLAELAARYRALDDDRRADLAELGKAGTRQHRLDPTRQPFGVTEAERARFLEARADAAHTQQLAAKCATTRSAELAKALVQQQTGGFKASEAISAAHRRMRALASRTKKEDKRRTDVLRSFAASESKDIAAEVRDMLAFPADMPLELLAVPNRAFPMFEVQSHASKLAAKMVASSIQKGPTTPIGEIGRQLGLGLEAFWHAEHKDLLHSEPTPLPKGMRLQRGSLCWQAGFCVCSGEGRKVSTFRTRFLQQLSSWFPRGNSEVRSKLQDGFFVLHLIGCPVDDMVGGGDVVLGRGEVHIWVHIAAMYLSPWRPTLHTMVDLGPIANEIRLLDASCRWSTLWDFSRAIGVAGMAWGMEAWELLHRRVALPSFDPSKPRVRRLESGEFKVFWLDKKGKRRPPLRALAWDDHLADLDRVDLAIEDGPLADGGDEAQPDDSGGVADVIEHIARDVQDEESEPEEDADGGDAVPERPPGHEEGAPGPDHVVGHPPAGEGGAPAADGHGAVARDGDTVVCFFAGLGKITFYAKNTNFEAKCDCAAHRPRCTKTRTKKRDDRRPEQGRPLGYLVAWLQSHSATRQEHQDIDMRIRPDLCPDQAERLVARLWARGSSVNFETLEGCEGFRTDGEGEEPAVCP